MLGFLFGTVCLGGLVGMAARGGRRGWGGPGCGRGGWGDDEGPRWRGGPGRWGRHHHGFAHHGWGHGGWGRGDHGEDGEGWGPWGRGGMEEGARRMLRYRLHLRDEQEDAVWDALKEGRKALDTFLADLRATRADLASAVRGEAVDDDRLAAVFESHDDSLKTARRDLVEALRRAHASLDPDQRAKVAELLERGPGRWM